MKKKSSIFFIILVAVGLLVSGFIAGRLSIDPSGQKNATEVSVQNSDVNVVRAESEYPGELA